MASVGHAAADGAAPPAGDAAQIAREIAEARAAKAELDALVAGTTEFDSKRERFLPLTRFALLDRLTIPSAWRDGEEVEVRRFFRYLDYWRQQQYAARILDLEQTYEPFNPDTDLLMTRRFSVGERLSMRSRLVEGVRHLLQQANYERIDPARIELIMTAASHYGLDLTVDMSVFEEIEIWFRGATHKRADRRTLRRFFRKEEIEVPIFQRLFVLFKLKPFEERVAEEMEHRKVSRPQAEKIVRKLRGMLPAEVREGNVYLKMFKNIPRTDLEMVFPNTRVRFRLLDKVKLGLSAGGGLGIGAVGAAGKIAMLATNPIGAAGAVLGLGGVIFRQALAFMNQKQRYMVVMARNLYFHSMADNRGVMLKLANRAAEEDIKEEMLLFSVLAKERVRRADLPEIDRGIETWLATEFGISVDFDVHDALDRLVSDGIVTEQPDGTLVTLPAREAALHIDGKWDAFLDDLPDPPPAEGVEFEGVASGTLA